MNKEKKKKIFGLPFLPFILISLFNFSLLFRCCFPVAAVVVVVYLYPNGSIRIEILVWIRLIGR